MADPKWWTQSLSVEKDEKDKRTKGQEQNMRAKGEGKKERTRQSCR